MRRALLALALAACGRPASPPRGDVPQVPARCMGAEGRRIREEGTWREKTECAWSFFRRGCALGHEKSCELQRRMERELLEMAAGSPDR